MDFEPLDEELEGFLRGVIDKTDECSGHASGIDFMNPEYRELKELGYFDEIDTYLDCTALILPKRKALKYFDRKKEWERQKKVDVAKSIGEKVVDKGTDVVAAIAAKMASGQ